MKIKIVDSDLAPMDDGTYPKSHGGTERMKEGLLMRLPNHLKDQYQFICSRVRNIERDKKRILWLHDHYSDGENAHLRDSSSWERFHKMVFVSHHQFQTYQQAYNIPYNRSIVLKNCAEIFPDHEKPDIKDGIRLIYHTTPHRGLELLVPVFIKLAEKYDITLDVYSSFQIYGWPKRDEPYEKLFDICRNHPKINYHGFKPNSEIREALMKSHIFAYPSIWPETSCIAAIEAMMAGVAVVCSDLGALPETTLGCAMMYRFNENPKAHMGIFAYALEETIKNLIAGNLKNNLTFAKNYSTINYCWENRIPQWVELLENL